MEPEPESEGGGVDTMELCALERLLQEAGACGCCRAADTVGARVRQVLHSVGVGR